jgi:anti-sigma regulatory factor (Ser/Thr protein kinase)
MARDIGWNETRTGRAGIVATEAVTNMLKHAGGGDLIARRLARGATTGIEILAIDSGPGMESFAQSSRDGVSTSGTPGNGLGAISRLSHELDVYTAPGRGTLLRVMCWDAEGVPASPEIERQYEVGVVFVPKAGEEVCGDGWGMESHETGTAFVVADGLGHGPEASRAAVGAVDVVHRHPGQSALRLLDLAHARLRPTRGAAVAVMRHEAGTDELRAAAVGNIAACIIAGEQRRAILSHNGIVGHNIHKSEEYRYDWPPGSLLVAHSDGLASQWSLAAFPGLASSHPSLIAAMLFREHSRKRDDVGILVVRRSR